MGLWRGQPKDFEWVMCVKCGGAITPRRVEQARVDVCRACWVKPQIRAIKIHAVTCLECREATARNQAWTVECEEGRELADDLMHQWNGK